MTDIKRSKIVVLALSLLVAGCGEGVGREAVTGLGPQPGTIAISLVTQTTDVGAIKLTLTGSEISNLRAADGIELFPVERRDVWQIAALGSPVVPEV